MIMFLEGGGGGVRKESSGGTGRSRFVHCRATFFSRFNPGVNTSMLVSQGMSKASVAEDTRNLT